MEKYEDAFAGLVGYDDIKYELSVILEAMRRREEAEKLGAKIPQGLFLYGTPGNGKTAFAKAFMAASGRPSFVLTPCKDYLDRLRGVIEEAASAAPSCLLLDDFDKAADESDDWDTISSVQGLIDENAPRGIYFIVTANSLEEVPKSFYRKGRFDHFLRFNKPSPETGAELLYALARKLPGGEKLSEKDLAGFCRLSSYAKGRTLVNSAVMAAASRKAKEISISDFVEAALDFSSLEQEEESDATLLERAAGVAAKALVAEAVKEGSAGFLTARATPHQGILLPGRRPGAVAFFLAPRLGAELVLGLPQLDYSSLLEAALTYETAGHLHAGSHGVGTIFNGDGHDDNFAKSSTEAMGELLLPIAQDVRRFLVANRPVLLKLTERLYREPYLLRSQFEEFLKENPLDSQWLSSYLDNNSLTLIAK